MASTWTSTAASSPLALDMRRFLWLKQTPMLYEQLTIARREPLFSALAWDEGIAERDATTVQRLVAGMSASKRHPGGAIWVLSVQLPSEECSGAGPQSASRLQKMQHMPHEGAVRHIELSPHRKLCLATQSQAGDILIFDAASWQATWECPTRCCPTVRLKAPQSLTIADDIFAPRGANISWNQFHGDKLVAAAPEGGSLLWDVTLGTALAAFPGHQGLPASAVSCSIDEPDMFASCGTDGKACIWDIRCGALPSSCLAAHTGMASCIKFAPMKTPGIIATGGADAAVRLWDIRRSDRHLHELIWGECENTGGVNHLVWSPSEQGVLASGHHKGPVLVWDLSAAGIPQSSSEAKDGPPELCFVHGGHSGLGLSSLAWSASSPWTLASASRSPPSEDTILGTLNELHIWMPAKCLLPQHD